MKVISILVLLIGIIKGGEWFILLLPTAYLFLNLIFPKSLKYFSDNIINQVYQITLFVRFVILPLMMLFTYQNNFHNTLLYLDEGILLLSSFLMMGEMFFSLLLIQLFLKKKKQNTIIKSDNKYYLGLFSLIFGLLFFVDPTVNSNINFILTLF